MTLICECDHARKVHDAGNTTCADYRVKKCNHQGCTCKGYHADKNTRKIRTELIMASATLPAIIGLICIFGLMGAFVAIDFAFESFKIDYKTQYKKFEDGKEVPYTDLLGGKLSTAKDTLLFAVKATIGFIIMIGGVFSGLIYAMSYYESRMKELIES